MPSSMKTLCKTTRSHMDRMVRRSMKTNAAPTIRRIGDEWARRWAGDLDGVVASTPRTQSTFRHTTKPFTGEMPYASM
jgi:hypothetical protein